MKVISDIKSIEDTIAAQRYHGYITIEAEARLLTIIKNHTIEADLVKREDAVKLYGDCSIWQRSMKHFGKELPAWDGKA